MKKLLLTTAALALVLGLSQCKKPNMQAINGGNGEIQHVVLNATIDNGGSKIAEDGIGGIKWSVDDEIAVKQGATSLGTLECTNVNGTFEGDITSTSGDIQFTFGTQKFTEQTGSLNAAISLSSGDVAYNAEGSYNVTMTMPHAVLKLDLSALGTESGNVVTISAGSETVASVTGVTNAANNPYYVAMPAAENKEYTFSGNGKTAKVTWTLVANTFYTKSGSSTGEAIVIASQPEHEYVDLGLSVLWATCNVGAENPKDYGDYFAWGETETKTNYSWGTYKYGTSDNLTKYNATDGKTTLDSDDDAATAAWGAEWRMPTREEFAELFNDDNTSWAWTADYNGTGVKGRIVKGKKEGYTDKSIFLPVAGGFYDEGGLFGAGSDGFYWSSSLSTDVYPSRAHNLYIGFYLVFPQIDDQRYRGFSVRPVRASQK